MHRSVLVSCVAALAALVLGAAPASASELRGEGCPPAHWKNHPDRWLENHLGEPSYDPHELFGDLFDVDYDLSLLEALEAGRGPGIAGAQAVLARSATAALLNAAHDDLAYPLRRLSQSHAGPGLLPLVEEAWYSGDRDLILRTAARLDRLDAGGCPLNRIARLQPETATNSVSASRSGGPWKAILASGRTSRTTSSSSSTSQEQVE
jgi:hypothetical protein